VTGGNDNAVTPGPACQREKRGGEGTAADRVATSVTKIGERSSASPEFLTSATSVLGEGGEVVDGAWKGVPQPMARLTSVAGFRGDGGGLPLPVRRWCAVDMALEALNIPTN
jgi:hypothetical protein